MDQPIATVRQNARDSGGYAPRAKVDWHIARRLGLVKKIADPKVRTKAEREERRKAQIRAPVEHPFRVLKRQFGYTKTCFKGLAKNAAQIVTLFALANLYLVRRHLMAMSSASGLLGRSHGRGIVVATAIATRPLLPAACRGAGASVRRPSNA